MGSTQIVTIPLIYYLQQKFKSYTQAHVFITFAIAYY